VVSLVIDSDSDDGLAIPTPDGSPIEEQDT